MPWSSNVWQEQQDVHIDVKEPTVENVMEIVKELEGVIEEGVLLSKTLSISIDKLHQLILKLPSPQGPAPSSTSSL